MVFFQPSHWADVTCSHSAGCCCSYSLTSCYYVYCWGGFYCWSCDYALPLPGAALCCCPFPLLVCCIFDFGFYIFDAGCVFGMRGIGANLRVACEWLRDLHKKKAGKKKWVVALSEFIPSTVGLHNTAHSIFPARTRRIYEICAPLPRTISCNLVSIK